MTAVTPTNLFNDMDAIVWQQIGIARDVVRVSYRVHSGIRAHMGPTDLI